MSEPTLAEVVRQLDRVAAQLTNLATEIRNDRLAAAQTYVARETYQSDQRLVEALFKAVRNDVTELEKARDDDMKWRRAASFQLAIVAAGWLVTIALAVFALLTR